MCGILLKQHLGEFIILNSYIKNKERLQASDLNFHIKKYKDTLMLYVRLSQQNWGGEEKLEFF